MLFDHIHLKKVGNFGKFREKLMFLSKKTFSVLKFFVLKLKLLFIETSFIFILTVICMYTVNLVVQKILAEIKHFKGV